ncbi:hypothetical protein HK102_005616 [Quaeritorhiza haematococci]|nr:hypothetical protein HK102_005616 [Quaeritorhiza haematococci]
MSAELPLATPTTQFPFHQAVAVSLSLPVAVTDGLAHHQQLAQQLQQHLPQQVQQHLQQQTLPPQPYLTQLPPTLQQQGRKLKTKSPTYKGKQKTQSASTVQAAEAAEAAAGSSSSTSNDSKPNDASIPNSSADPFDKERRVYPVTVTRVLKHWLSENVTNPYPNRETKLRLAEETGLTVQQIGVWFTKARGRYCLLFGTLNDLDRLVSDIRKIQDKGTLNRWLETCRGKLSKVLPSLDVDALLVQEDLTVACNTILERVREMKEEVHGQIQDDRPHNRRPNYSQNVRKVLKEWLFQNAANPYPDEATKIILCTQTGLDMTQLNDWFINARRRFLPKKDENSA